MIESAEPQDDDYLLRHLDHTVFRVRASANSGVRPAPGSLEELILSAVREHPGTTVATLWQSVPRLHERDYRRVQDAVVGMIDEHTLERAGQAPLETVDARYVRVLRCAVCGATADTHPVLFWKQNTPVVQCTECGLIYANPRRRTGDTVQKEQADAAAADPTRAAWWQATLQRLAAGQSSRRLLDVDGGTGEFLAMATAAGWAAYGIASSGDQPPQTGQPIPTPSYSGPLDMAAWPAGWFDVVTLWDVIDQQPSPRATLAQVARLLRPGGMIMLTTPNIRSLSYARWGRTWPTISPNTRLYYFAPHTLARLLTDTGFAVQLMTTRGPDQEIWQQMLPLPQVQSLIARLHPLAQGVAQRFRAGDTLQVFARRVSPETPAAPAEPAHP